MYPGDTPGVNATARILLLDRVRAVVYPHPTEVYVVESATAQYGPTVREIAMPGGARRHG